MEERLRLALLTLLLLSPLPFGCVEDWSRWLLVTLLALAFCGVLWYRIPILLSPREKKAAILGCIYAGWLLVQLVPLPPSLLARLSPSAHHLYQIGVPGYGTSDPKGYAYPDPEQISAGRDLRDVTWVVPGLSAWRSLSLYPYGTYRVFWQTAALIGFTIIGLSLFRDREDRRRLAGVLVAVGVFQAAYGAIEALSGHQHIFAYEKRYYTDVATGTLVNRNHFAAMLNMVLPLALALLLVRVRALSAQGVRASRTRLARWSLLAGEPWFLACAVTIGLGVVLSRSRMGVLAMLAGVAGFGVLAARWGAADAAAAARLRQRSHTRWAIVVPLILIAIIAAVALGMDAAPTLDRFVRISEDLKQGATRPALWKEGLGTAVEYLWTGAGAGAYVHALNPHLKTLFSSDFWIFNHAHNDYIETLATVGPFGLIIALAAIGLLVCRRTTSYVGIAAVAGIGTVAFHSLADFLIATPSNALIASALLCLTASPTVPPRRPVASSFPRRAVIAVLLGAVLFWPGRALMAAVIYRPHWHTELDRPEAISALTTAAALDPGNDSYLRWLAQGERDAALRARLGEVNLSGDFEQQVRGWQAARLSGLARAQRRYLESLDLSPIDYSLHAEIAHVATLTRRLCRQVNVSRPAEWTEPESITSPFLASASLGPTAYANLASIGSILWDDRLDLGDTYADAALQILHGASGRPEIGVAWLESLVKGTGDAVSLARLDEALTPFAYMYDLLPAQDAGGQSDSFRECSRALKSLAQVRDAKRDLAGSHPFSGPEQQTPERLRALRATLLGLQAGVASHEAPSGNGPCGGDYPRASEMDSEIRGVVALIDQRLGS